MENTYDPTDTNTLNSTTDYFYGLIINKATGSIFSVNARGYKQYVVDSDSCRLATKEEALALVKDKR